MNDLVEQAGRSIRAQTLLRRGERILVAVSGGVDSMVLLDILHKLSRNYSWHLTVAHLNHQLRGRSSDADERLVVRAANVLGLPVVIERADVKRAARDRKLSIEMAAREVRHDFLARTAARLNIRRVALAHHADDQLELFFLRLLRGSGSDGLAGMKWRNPSPGNPKVQLVRPLLDCSKADLYAYARGGGIRFREDATNASPDFLRNRIRRELLPLLRRKYQPALARTVSRVMNIAGAEAEFIKRVAVEWLSAREDARPTGMDFGELPVAVQRRCIQLQLQRRRIPVDYELVERLRTCPGQIIKVSAKSAVILKTDGKLGFQEPEPAIRLHPAQCKVDLSGRTGEIMFGNLKLFWRILSRKARNLPKPRAGREVFDADKVGSPVFLRHWRAGDRFQPIGMTAAVKLQDLFTNLKIPRLQRHDLAVATTSANEVFWVEKVRMSERFKVSEETIRCLQWRWKRL